MNGCSEPLDQAGMEEIAATQPANGAQKAAASSQLAAGAHMKKENKRKLIIS